MHPSCLYHDKMKKMENIGAAETFYLQKKRAYFFGVFGFNRSIVGAVEDGTATFKFKG
jgi:hypothetical protein